MNTAYAQHSPPHDMHRGSLPNMNDPGYRPAPNGPQYPPYSMPGPSQMGQPPNEYQSHNPPPTARPPPEQVQAGSMQAVPMHAGDGHVPIVPGTQPAAAEPMSRSLVENGRKYELHVVQQPKRARMCGFGDKDRRPITPPPCVRLIITDISSGKEVDCNDVDHGMFVINVDLWSADGVREVNLVRHSATSPSISSTTPVSYQDIGPSVYPSIMPQSGVFKIEPGQGPQGAPYNPFPDPPQVNPYSGQGAPQSYYQPNNYAPPTNGQSYPPQNGYSQPGAQPAYYTGPAGPGSMAYPPAHQQASHQYGPGVPRPYTPQEIAVLRSPVNQNPQGMFTRNLIGSLAASAFRLTDPDDRIGIWFVLQDLSVRTEGNFRLRFSFVNVGLPVSPSNPQGGSVSSMQVNTGKAPVLAACFSDVFTVYSAKRFPGVVESTALSKCFATQGIKIPIRKDGPGKGDKDKEYEED